MEKKLNNKHEVNRAIKIIKQYNEILSFNLCGFTVFTEVGSNNYLYSPIIPLLCGADHVFAFVKDTKFGKAEKIKKECIEIADFLGISDKLTIGENDFVYEWLSKADIITNSGMLRPLDKNKLSYIKKGAVIPLMFEAWEFRESDLDLTESKKLGIKIAGTWENHPKIRVFDSVKMLCLKMAFEAGYEIQGNTIFVWSDDHFGELILDSFKSNGAKKCYLSTDKSLLNNVISQVDFIFFADYDGKENLFDLIDFKNHTELSHNFGIVHLFGDINVHLFKNLGINIYPDFNGNAEQMSFTLSHVGLLPILKLQVAGYRVAYEMLKNQITSISQIV